jgi:biotin carboxyl carrier protein
MKYFAKINGQEVELEIDGDQVSLAGSTTQARISDIERSPEHVLTLGNEVHRILVRRGASRGAYTVWVDGTRLEVEALDERSRAIRELSAAASGPKGPAPLMAPMPGMIVRVNVSEGDAVQTGQGLVVMEAMKMENELRASASGTVKRVHVAPGTAVEKGALLLEME